MKKSIMKYGIRLFIMAVVIVLFLKWINISDSIYLLSEVKLEYFFVALVLILFANLIKGVRFFVLTEALKLKLSFLRVLLVNSMCIIVGRVTPGRVGEVVKIMFFDRKKTDLTFCFVLEKIIDVFLVLFIAILGIGVLLQEGIFSSFVNSYILFGVILLLIIIVIFNIDKVLKFITKRDILEEKWFLRGLKKISYKQWAWFVLISLLIRTCALALAYLVALSLGIEGSWLLIIIIWNLAIIVGQVSALPGGFGAREAGYTGLLVSYVGITKQLAGIAAVLITIVDLIVESFLAIVCWILLKVLYKK